MRDQEVRAKHRRLGDEPPVRVQDEGAAVEHQLVLAADLIAVDQRQAGLGHARHREIEAKILFVMLERRAVGHHQNLGAALLQAFGDVFGPHVLADHHAEPHLRAVGKPKRDRTGNRARREDALLVEDAVIRQVVLEAERLDLAVLQEGDRVVEGTLLRPGRADQQGRTAVGRISGQRLDGAPAILLKRRFQHQVLRRIAADHQFGEQHQVGAGLGSARSGLADQSEIALDVSHRRIGLGDGDDDVLGHDGFRSTCEAGSRNGPAAARYSARRRIHLAIATIGIVLRKPVRSPVDLRPRGPSSR